MLSLKIAKKEDEDNIVPLIEDLFNETVYSKFCVFDPSSVRAVLDQVFKSPNDQGCCIQLLDDGRTVGVLVCSVILQMFNSKHKTAVEIAFWIDHDHRSSKAYKMLLGAYKYWAKKIGCNSILYGKLKNNNSPEEYIMRKL